MRSLVLTVTYSLFHLETSCVASVIFLPSVISSDSITFLVVFLFVGLGERLVVDLMGWRAPAGGGAAFADGGGVGLSTEAKQDRWVNIFTLVSNSNCESSGCIWLLEQMEVWEKIVVCPGLHWMSAITLEIKSYSQSSGLQFYSSLQWWSRLVFLLLSPDRETAVDTDEEIPSKWSLSTVFMVGSVADRCIWLTLSTPAAPRLCRL